MAYGEEYAKMERESRPNDRDQCAEGPSVTKAGAIQRHSSIAGRIDRTLREAQSTYERAAAAQRAKELIEKHPEFAELLDLLNRF